MKGAASTARMTFEQDRQISEVVLKERSRLRNFIRRRVPDPRDAEDILQDVFYELVEANRLLMPIEHLTGWLFRVARNRITDLFRKKGRRASARLPLQATMMTNLFHSKICCPRPMPARRRFTPAACFLKNSNWRLPNSRRTSVRCLWDMNSKDAASSRWRPRPG